MPLRKYRMLIGVFVLKRKTRVNYAIMVANQVDTRIWREKNA